MKKEIIWHTVFILILGVFLALLSETENMYVVTKFPFVTILLAYFLGRFSNYFSREKNSESITN